jgi:hypothetical protein
MTPHHPRGGFVAGWMSIAHAACEQAAIQLSLQNLMSFPWVSERVEQRTLQLDGWYYDLDHGDLQPPPIGRPLRIGYGRVQVILGTETAGNTKNACTELALFLSRLPECLFPDHADYRLAASLTKLSLRVEALVRSMQVR